MSEKSFSELLGEVDVQLSRLDGVQQRLEHLQELLDEYEQMVQTLAFYRHLNEQKGENNESNH